jgi:hypothetical protein
MPLSLWKARVAWGGPLLALLVSGLAPAAPRLAVVAVGDCQDLELIADLRGLVTELNRARPGIALELPSAQAVLGAPSSASPEDLARQLDTAQSLFYNAASRKAERQALDALADIDRLPPGDARWALRVRAELFLALYYKNVGPPDAFDGALKQVLRLAPTHKLDPFYFSTGVRARFDKLRAQLAAGPKVKLDVTSTPTGADVFLDGLRVGNTPYSGEQVPGAYVLELGKQGGFSLQHPVKLNSDTQVRVDLGFEGAIHPARLTCVNGPADERVSLRHGVMLGTLLGLDEVVVLRLDRPRAGPGWLTVSLLNVTTGQKVRDGGIKVKDLAALPEGLDELAAFVVTGQMGARVSPEARAPEPAVATAAGPTAPVEAPQAEAPPGLFARRTWKSKAGVGLGVLSLVGLGAGVAFEVLASSSWREFNAYYAGGKAPTLAQVGTVKEIQARATTWQNVGLGCFGVTALAAAGAIALLYFDGPAEASLPVQASFAPTPAGGATLVLSGRY